MLASFTNLLDMQMIVVVFSLTRRRGIFFLGAKQEQAAEQDMFFFGLSCPEQGMSLTGSDLVLNRVWYYELRDINLDCKQSLSFPNL